MDIQKFFTLQIFELIYIVSLAFLPFIIVIKEVTIFIFIVIALISATILVRKLLMKRVNPEGKVIFISGCDSGWLFFLLNRILDNYYDKIIQRSCKLLPLFFLQWLTYKYLIELELYMIFSQIREKKELSCYINSKFLNEKPKRITIMI